MPIEPIKNEVEYDRALGRVEELWDSPEGSAESGELDALATLIEAYEREHYPVEMATSLVHRRATRRTRPRKFA